VLIGIMSIRLSKDNHDHGERVEPIQSVKLL
jgi:hypothetical protein